jgi:aryl-alcohol dehydrogenase-like predicted oxidoreductase
MEYRNLGRTGLKVSELFGTMINGRRTKRVQVFGAAIKPSVNFLDSPTFTRDGILAIRAA